MKKRLFAILIVLIMVFAVAGCGGSEAPANTANDSPATSDSGTASAEPTGEPIKWGGWTYLTGVHATLGKCIENSMLLGVKHINERGGINGRPVEITIYDNASQTDQAGQVVTRLVEQDKVKAVIGSCTTPELLTYMPLLEDRGIPNTTCGTSASATNLGNKYTFRVTGPATMTDKVTFEKMQEMGITSLAMLAVQNEWGVQGIEQYAQWCEDAGISFTNESFTLGDTDFTGQVAKLTNTDPDCFLVYANNGRDVSNIVKQLRRTGWTDYVWATEACATAEYRDVAGEDGNGTVYVTTSVVPDDPEDAVNEQEKQFLIDYYEEYGEYPPADTGYRAYDATQLMAIAFETAEDIDDPESLSEAFFNIKGYEGIQGTFDYTDRTGEGLYSANPYVIDGGKNIPWSKWIETHDITKPYNEG